MVFHGLTVKNVYCQPVIKYHSSAVGFGKVFSSPTSYYSQKTQLLIMSLMQLCKDSLASMSKFSSITKSTIKPDSDAVFLLHLISPCLRLQVSLLKNFSNYVWWGAWCQKINICCYNLIMSLTHHRKLKTNHTNKSRIVKQASVIMTDIFMDPIYSDIVSTV